MTIPVAYEMISTPSTGYHWRHMREINQGNL
jgi:hypothetical protein